MSDADTALAILRKLGADRSSSFLVERTRGEGGIFLIDSSWTDATNEELDLLDRLSELEHEVSGGT